MIIEDWKGKIKTGWGKVIQYQKELYWTLLLAVLAVLSFGLGRLSKIEELKPSIKIIDCGENVNSTAIGQKMTGVVVSKSGTKYHFPWCFGASSIKPANQVWFTTEAEAVKAGYTKAANCK